MGKRGTGHARTKDNPADIARKIHGGQEHNGIVLHDIVDDPEDEA
jgi:hypothetical protein